MSKKIIAIGGGENGRMKKDIKTPYELELFDKETIKLTNKAEPNFLFIGHALSILEDQESYYNLMKNMYENKYGV